jgi:hypothetical protein
MGERLSRREKAEQNTLHPQWEKAEKRSRSLKARKGRKRTACTKERLHLQYSQLCLPGDSSTIVVDEATVVLGSDGGEEVLEAVDVVGGSVKGKRRKGRKDERVVDRLRNFDVSSSVGVDLSSDVTGVVRRNLGVAGRSESGKEKKGRGKAYGEALLQTDMGKTQR